MSLLLQALQKASKSREGGGDAPQADPLDSDELTLEPVGSAEPAQREPGGGSPAPTPTPAQAAVVMQASRAPRFDPVEYAREHYMIVFVALAVLAAIGYGAYVYVQISNPGWFRAPPRPPETTPLAVAPAPAATEPNARIGGLPTPAEVAPAPAATAVVAAPPTEAAPPAAPSLIASAQGKPARTEAVPTRRKRAAAAPEQQEVMARQVDDEGVETVVLQPASPAAEASAARIQRASGIAAVDPELMQAYEALQSGDTALAKTLYAEVLRKDQRSIDASLGLAAIAWKEGRAEEAAQHYQHVLELDPRNAHAQAGLISIIGGADPQASEGRLRQLIAREPSAFLYFTLGNLYADQGLWPAAQQAYFQAYQSQPDNPDYAFNLAVGLEHVGQVRPALDYYRKALDLSFRKGRANFDQNLVIQRVGQLSTRVDQ